MKKMFCFLMAFALLFLGACGAGAVSARQGDSAESSGGSGLESVAYETGVADDAPYGDDTWSDVVERFKGRSAAGQIEPVNILFADKDKIIFYDIGALLIYDIKNKKISYAMDLIEKNYTYREGSDAVSISISKNGDIIYFSPFDSDSKIRSGILDVKANKFSYDNFDTNDLDLFSQYVSVSDLIGEGLYKPGGDEWFSLSGVTPDNEYVFLSGTGAYEMLDIVFLKNDGQAAQKKLSVFEAS